MLSKEEAFADLDSLVYAMQEIHPDLFFECNESKFFSMLNDVRKKLSHDSISVIELYKYAQPLTTILGDGHTQLYFPKNELTDNLFFPLSVYINQNDSSIQVNTDYNSKEGVIEKGKKILSINGVNYKCIIENMLKNCGGDAFSLSYQK